MDKHQLASGEIKVWRQDWNEVVIHHSAGLTISLNELEELELFQWLKDDLEKRGEILRQREADQERIAEIKDFILTQWPKIETLGKNDQYLVNYHIGVLKKDFDITTIIGDNSVTFREGKL